MNPRILPLLLLALAPAAFAAGDGAVEYVSGTVPQTFDLIVVQAKKQVYEADGVAYTFETLIDRVRKEGTTTVLLQGRGTPQDVLCASTLGLETGKSVFLIGSDGRPKSLSWKADAKQAAKAAKDCRA